MRTELKDKTEKLDKGEIVAEVDGGKAGNRRRLYEFVALCAAGNTRSAAEVEQVQREYGSDPLLRRDSQIAHL